MGDGTSSFPHFLVSQAINLIWVILVWFILFYAIQPEGLRMAMEESFYFIFAYLGIAIMMFFICWLPDADCQPFLVIMAVIGGIGGAIFIGLFFGIFFKPLNYTYLPSENCTITRTSIANFDDAEKYAVMNVQFKNQNGDTLNGYGCASNKKESGMGSAPYVYSYYQRDESIGCYGSKGISLIDYSILESSYYKDEVTQTDSTNQNTAANTDTGGSGTRFLQMENNFTTASNSTQLLNTNQESEQSQNITQQNKYTRRNAKVGGSSGGSSGGSYSGGSSSYSSSYSSYGSSYYDSDGGGGEVCTYSQNFTDIKLSAWHCMEYNDYIKDLTNRNQPAIYKQCYYTTYGDKNKALENAQNQTMKAENMTDFYMVTFEDPPYYDKTAFLLIIGFCFIPFLSFLHFCWIPYAANGLEPKIKKCCSNCCKNRAVPKQKKEIQNQDQYQSKSNKKEKIKPKPRKSSVLSSEGVLKQDNNEKSVRLSSELENYNNNQVKQIQNNNNNNQGKQQANNNYNFDNIDNQYDQNQNYNNNNVIQTDNNNNYAPQFIPITNLQPNSNNQNTDNYDNNNIQAPVNPMI